MAVMLDTFNNFRKEARHKAHVHHHTDYSEYAYQRDQKNKLMSSQVTSDEEKKQEEQNWKKKSHL